MIDKPKHACSRPTLVLVADAVCAAAEKYANQLNKRLPQGFIAAVRNLIKKVSSGVASQKKASASVGDLTKEQNSKLAALDELLGQVRETAKKAFRGHDVKLHEQFRVGVKSGYNLATVLQEARIVHDACTQAENRDALSAKGWLQSDTERLAEAIDDLDATDITQETAKKSKTGVTGDLVRDANELYDNVLTIQNAANIEWPASDSSSASIRGEFRLGSFPGHAAASAAKEKVDTSQAKAPSAPPSQPTQPSAQPSA